MAGAATGAEHMKWAYPTFFSEYTPHVSWAAFEQQSLGPAFLGRKAFRS